MKVVVRTQKTPKNKASQIKKKQRDTENGLINDPHKFVLLDNAPTPPVAPDEKEIGFWKGVWWIIKGKGSENSSFATAIVAGVLSVMFNALFVVGLILTLIATAASVQFIFDMTWTMGEYLQNAGIITLMVFICGLMFMISIMFRGAANDLKHEKDRNYIIALFSGMVSFVALIISLIALK